MRRLLALILLIPVTALFGFVIGSYRERNKEIPFNRVLWRAGSINQTIAGDVDPFRHRMVKDLLTRHLHRGMSKAQVTALLGDPSYEDPEAREIRYWLTEEHGWGLDAKSVQHLVIKLDSSGNVEHVHREIRRK